MMMMMMRALFCFCGASRSLSESVFSASGSAWPAPSLPVESVGITGSSDWAALGIAQTAPQDGKASRIDDEQIKTK